MTLWNNVKFNVVNSQATSLHDLCMQYINSLENIPCVLLVPICPYCNLPSHRWNIANNYRIISIMHIPHYTDHSFMCGNCPQSVGRNHVRYAVLLQCNMLDFNSLHTFNGQIYFHKISPSVWYNYNLKVRQFFNNSYLEFIQYMMNVRTPHFVTNQMACMYGFEVSCQEFSFWKIKKNFESECHNDTDTIVSHKKTIHVGTNDVIIVDYDILSRVVEIINMFHGSKGDGNIAIILPSNVDLSEQRIIQKFEQLISPHCCKIFPDVKSIVGWNGQIPDIHVNDIIICNITSLHSFEQHVKIGENGRTHKVFNLNWIGGIYLAYTNKVQTHFFPFLPMVVTLCTPESYNFVWPLSSIVHSICSDNVASRKKLINIAELFYENSINNKILRHITYDCTEFVDDSEIQLSVFYQEYSIDDSCKMQTLRVNNELSAFEFDLQ